MKTARKKHNYTSELELKSLLIRIKNRKQDKGTLDYNTRINKYLKWHTKVTDKKYKYPAKKTIVKNKLKDKIIELSERTRSDKVTYERFGEIILLMIKNILKKPQFSGYTYRDDFYSDAIYKILKYLHNFDHTMISEISGQPVNAFAYISQIIHNSILFIINTKKKEMTNLRKQVDMSSLNHEFKIKDNEQQNCSTFDPHNIIIETIELTSIKTTLLDEIKKLHNDIEKSSRLDIYYPSDYRISFEEYDLLKPYLKGKISIMRKAQ